MRRQPVVQCCRCFKVAERDGKTTALTYFTPTWRGKPVTYDYCTSCGQAERRRLAEIKKKCVKT